MTGENKYTFNSLLRAAKKLAKNQLVKVVERVLPHLSDDSLERILVAGYNSIKEKNPAGQMFRTDKKEFYASTYRRGAAVPNIAIFCEVENADGKNEKYVLMTDKPTMGGLHLPGGFEQPYVTGGKSGFDISTEATILRETEEETGLRLKQEKLVYVGKPVSYMDTSQDLQIQIHYFAYDMGKQKSLPKVSCGTDVDNLIWAKLDNIKISRTGVSNDGTPIIICTYDDKYLRPEHAHYINLAIKEVNREKLDNKIEFGLDNSTGKVLREKEGFYAGKN